MLGSKKMYRAFWKINMVQFGWNIMCICVYVCFCERAHVCERQPERDRESEKEPPGV